MSWLKLKFLTLLGIAVIFSFGISNVQFISAKEQILQATFYTIYGAEPSPQEIKIINVTSFTLNGTASEIKQKFPVDKVYAMFEGKPAIFDGTAPNETKVINHPTKQDYLRELDFILKTQPNDAKPTKPCGSWFFSVQGPAMNRHTRCSS